MSEPLLTMQHLEKRFGDQKVLQAVDLTVAPGEIVGLIGPSGAGKSTVIKIALGMLTADAGNTAIMQTQMPNRELLGHIGYMAQDDALYMTLSARENLRFFGRMKGVARAELPEAIAHVAAVVDLTADLDKRVAGFSGGMKRRLSLAIALLGNPELLILDEPTVGIDPALRRSIWRELGKIRTAGRGILITTHVMSEAEQVDKVALLMAGKVIACASPQQLEADYGVDSIEAVFLHAEGVV